MSAPYEQQKALAALLTDAGLPTEPEVPERYTPPVRYALASSPWLESGQTVGSWRAHFRVVCVTGRGTNEVQMTELGAMVRAVIRALAGSRFVISAQAVDQPAEIGTGAGVSLGAAVNIVTAISRAEFLEE
ncbi:hypothetical protein [Oerskovia paurometabola]|uniref:hypothetical protein n=1 Tax=Oerskovia paurometabola TaxID=162170 RepID=UPI0038136F96